MLTCIWGLFQSSVSQTMTLRGMHSVSGLLSSCYVITSTLLLTAVCSPCMLEVMSHSDELLKLRFVRSCMLERLFCNYLCDTIHALTNCGLFDARTVVLQLPVSPSGFPFWPSFLLFFFFFFRLNVKVSRVRHTLQIPRATSAGCIAILPPKVQPRKTRPPSWTAWYVAGMWALSAIAIDSYPMFIKYVFAPLEIWEGGSIGLRASPSMHRDSHSCRRCA